MHRIRLTGVSKIIENRPLKGRFSVIFSGFMIFLEFLEFGDQVKAITVGLAPGGRKFPLLVPRANRLRAYPQKNRRLFYRQVFFSLELHCFLYAIIALMFSLRELSLLCLYAAFFLLPLWVLPFTASPLDLNKIYLAYFLFMLAAVFWFAHSLRTGRVVLPKNLAFVFLAVFLASFAVSAFLSPNALFARSCFFLPLSHWQSSFSFFRAF